MVESLHTITHSRPSMRPTPSMMEAIFATLPSPDRFGRHYGAASGGRKRRNDPCVRRDAWRRRAKMPGGSERGGGYGKLGGLALDRKRELVAREADDAKRNAR